jgi:hypothetical protein
MVANIESSIWERVVEPSWDDLSPEAANALLRLRFQQRDIDRMNELSALARDGALSEVQERELEMYNRVGHMLAIMQSKARMALNKPTGR